MLVLSRPGLAVLVGWLLVTALPLIAGTAGPGAATGRVRHAVLLGAALAALAFTRLARRSPASAGRIATEWWAVVLGWLPLVAVPALYAELPRIAAGIAGAGTGFAPMHDALAIRWELAVFGPLLGGSPALVLARHLPWRPLSELLHLAYLSYYPIIYIPPAVLWWEARRRQARGAVTGASDPQAAFATSAFTVLLAFVLCYAVFVFFPVQGPWYTWHTGDPGTLPLAGLVRAFVQGLLVAGSSRGTAFPSSHVAVSVAQTLVLGQVAPRLAWVAGPATLLLAIGAVYGGYHYGVDAMAGAVMGGVAGAVGPRVVERVGRRRR